MFKSWLVCLIQQESKNMPKTSDKIQWVRPKLHVLAEGEVINPIQNITRHKP